MPELLPIGPPELGNGSIAEAALAALTQEQGEEFKAKDLRAFRMRRLMALTDIAALTLAWATTGAFLDLIGRATATPTEFVLFLAFLPVWVLLGSLGGLYHSADRRVDPSIADEAGKLLMLVTAWVWSYLLVRGAITSGPNQLMPAALLWLTVTLTLLLLRPLGRHYAHTRTWYLQTVVVVGRRDDVDRVSRRLTRHPEYGFKALSRPDVWERLSRDHGGNVLVNLVRSEGAARVMIATPLSSVERRGEVIRSLQQAGVQVDLATGSADSFTPSVVLNYLEGIPVMSVPVIQRSKAMRVMKRLFDVAASSIALVGLSPLLLFCAIRIKLDTPGPVFYRQLRHGRDEKPFMVFKFRSMIHDADSQKSEIGSLNMHAAGGDARMFKVPQDPRVTRSGAWLRRWSLDELPQLLNVIRGEMSLVGPRPLIPEEATLIDAHYKERFKVLPGLTGAWQAHGRSDIGFEDMVQLDYMYVSNWSFSEDLKLILRTIEVILHGRGAY